MSATDILSFCSSYLLFKAVCKKCNPTTLCKCYSGKIQYNNRLYDVNSKKIVISQLSCDFETLLEFLLNFKNLRELTLLNVNTNFLDLKELGNLEHLTIIGGNINKLYSSRSLRTLKIYVRPCVSIHFYELSESSSLDTLILVGGYFNLDAIPDLYNLRILNLHITLSCDSIEIGNLKNLDCLESLELRGKTKYNVFGIENLYNLVRLVDSTDSLNVLDLEELTELEYLEITNSKQELNLGAIVNFLNLDRLILESSEEIFLGHLSELCELKYLKIKAGSIVNLSGIESLYNLQYLHIEGDENTNLLLGKLNKLSNLIVLKLTAGVFVNFCDIECLVNLWKLELNVLRSKNKIKIGNFSKLQNLRYLSLEGTAKYVLSHIKKAKNLKYIIDNTDSLNVHNFSCFEKLLGLKISGKYSTIMGLEHLSELRILEINSSRDLNLNSIELCLKLNTLVLVAPKIENISDIEIGCLSNLKYLTLVNRNVQNENISSLDEDEYTIDVSDGIDELTELKSLVLGFLKIENLSEVDDLEKLRYLNITVDDSIDVNDFSERISKLNILSLNCTGEIENVNNVTNANKLIFLSIDSKEGALDIGDISALHNLISVNISGEITNLSGLDNLSNLSQITINNLSDTPVVSSVTINLITKNNKKIKTLFDEIGTVNLEESTTDKFLQKIKGNVDLTLTFNGNSM